MKYRKRKYLTPLETNTYFFNNKQLLNEFSFLLVRNVYDFKFKNRTKQYLCVRFLLKIETCFKFRLNGDTPE